MESREGEPGGGVAVVPVKASSGRCHVNATRSRCGSESLPMGEGHTREGEEPSAKTLRQEQQHGQGLARSRRGRERIRSEEQGAGGAGRSAQVLQMSFYLEMGSEKLLHLTKKVKSALTTPYLSASV